MLYLYADNLSGKNTIEFVTFSEPFITVNKSENVLIENIHFNKGLDKGIVVTESKNTAISDCSFSNISSTVVTMTGSLDSKIEYCTFEEIGGTGVRIDCGDRETLTPGNCIVTNCVFDGFQRISLTQNPGISLNSVGNTASHNVLKDAVSTGIWITGNDNIVEYNDVSDVCTDNTDAGAIYAGADWSARGNEIRYNYIHDIKIIDSNRQ